MSLIGLCAAWIIVAALAAILALELKNVSPELPQLIGVDFAAISIRYLQQGRQQAIATFGQRTPETSEKL